MKSISQGRGKDDRMGNQFRHEEFIFGLLRIKIETLLEKGIL